MHIKHSLNRKLIGFLYVCIGALFACSTVMAQDGAARATASRDMASVQVIPQPKQVERRGGDFPLGRNDVRLVLADAKSTDDRFAAQDFIDDAREASGVSLTLARGGGNSRNRRMILIGTLDISSVRAALEREGVSVPANLNEEGYVLSASADRIVVAGRSAAGVFYGMQTLKQLVRGTGAQAYVPGVLITDWPSMRWRAFSDDISRGPVPTVDYIKKQIKTFAAFKMNMHSFYMEHTFASRNHPLIAPDGGALTPDEIRELASYARRYHIELVPEQQTFGHLHHVLKLEKYNDLAETPYGDVLAPEQPGTYKLVGDLYRELNDLFPGQFFHIGEDETFELGAGQSREAVSQRGVGAVYFEHLQRVHDLLQPYHRRLMMWGDIALNHPDLINRIPRDMIVMSWTYGPRPTYTPYIKPFKDAGLDLFVCPGVQNWNQIFPNLEAAVINIPGFVRDGQAANALGMMNTSWDDDGETLFEMTWYGDVLGAAAAWSEAPLDVANFDRNFEWAFFRSDGDNLTKSLRALGRVNATLGLSATNALFWQNPFTGQFQGRIRPLDEKTKQMRLAVEDVSETLMREQGRVRRHQEFIAAMQLAAARLDHLGRRMQVAEQFSRDYWKAYLNLGDKRAVNRLRAYSGAINSRLREMAEELSTLRESYRKQWLRENRPYWLESVLARYDLAINTWLTKARALDDALREYNENSTLPSPEEFGLGARPETASP